LGQVVSGVSFRTPPASPYVTRSSHLCLKVYGKKKKKKETGWACGTNEGDVHLEL